MFPNKNHNIGLTGRDVRAAKNNVGAEQKNEEGCLLEKTALLRLGLIGFVDVRKHKVVQGTRLPHHRLNIVRRTRRIAGE